MGPPEHPCTGALLGLSTQTWGGVRDPGAQENSRFPLPSSLSFPDPQRDPKNVKVEPMVEISHWAIHGPPGSGPTFQFPAAWKAGGRSCWHGSCGHGSARPPLAPREQTEAGLGGGPERPAQGSLDLCTCVCACAHSCVRAQVCEPACPRCLRMPVAVRVFV